MTATPLRLLFATWEGGGSVGPALTVARKLIARGHHVRVMSDRCNRAEVEAIGATFIPWKRAPSRPDRTRDSDIFRDWEVESPPDQFARVLDRLMCGPALKYAEDVVRELERAPADLVVSSEMLFGVMAGCEALGQKLALLSANINIFPPPGIPPLGPGLPPARTAEERALHAEIAEGNRELFARGLPALNAARAALGLRPLARVEDQLLAAERLLLGTAVAFDFPADELPLHIRYVGPQLDDPQWVKPWQSPWPSGDERPLILVAFSTSFQDHAGVVQRIIDAGADLPVRLLVTLGGLQADELSPAANCRLVESAPHSLVIPHSAIVVTHGGHGTVSRALVHRKPMLLVPHGRDQHDNAVRVTQRGAGLMVPATSSRAEFAVAIARLMTDPAFASAAAVLGDRVAAEAEHSPVVDELEAIARSSSCTTRRAAA